MYLQARYHSQYSDWTVRVLNPSGGKIFCTCPDRPWGPPSLLHNGYWVFRGGGKERSGRDDADPSPPSSAVDKKEYSYTSTPPMGHMACTEPHACTTLHFTFLPLLYIHNCGNLFFFSLSLFPPVLILFHGSCHFIY